MSTITGATAIFQLAVPALFPAPQQLQGFSADDVFDTDQLESVETLMGVDGNLSGGFVWKAIEQNISLQADSASNSLFDLWWATMKQNQDVLVAQAVVVLKTIGLKWTMKNGFLTGYTPVPSVKKLIQPRKYKITWNDMSPAVAS